MWAIASIQQLDVYCDISSSLPDATYIRWPLYPTSEKSFRLWTARMNKALRQWLVRFNEVLHAAAVTLWRNANNVEVDWQFRACHILSPTSPALQGFKLDHFIRSLFSSTSHLCHVALSNYWLHFTIVMRHSEASFSPFPSGHKTHLFPQCFHQHKPQGVLGCHSYCLLPIRPTKFAAKNKFI